MTKMVQLDRWTAEWYAASQKIRQLQVNCKSDSEMVFLHDVLEAFHQFGQEQIDLFKNGFDTDLQYQLEKSLTYPPQYVMRQTLNQIGEDVAVFRRVWRDRHHGTAAETETLKEVDWLTMQALQAVMVDEEGNGLIQPTQGLSYFQKGTRVRVIPYANGAFIGIPNTTVTIGESSRNKHAMLATAHEVGHHIYWHGMVEGKRLRILLKQYLPDQPPWLLAWLEELFADVYGALVGGEVMALSSQAMMLDNFPGSLTHDDGHYPISALRPTIYIDAMRIANEYHNGNLYREDILDKLDKLWEKRLIERRRPTQFRPMHPDDRSNETYVSLTKAREWLKSAIQIIIDDILKPYLTQLDTAWNFTQYDSKELHEKSFRMQLEKTAVQQAELDELYDPFEQLVAAIHEQELHARLPQVSFAKPKNSWRDQIFRSVKNPDSNAESLIIPTNAWVNIFRENNWVDAGPEGEPEIFGL